MLLLTGLLSKLLSISITLTIASSQSSERKTESIYFSGGEAGSNYQKAVGLCNFN